jgi:rhodanese-related sulfurtransferase
MEFMDFAIKYWYLFAALFVVIGLLIGTEVIRMMQGIVAVNPSRATQLINHDDALLLDVRETSSYKAGHIPDARHIPVKELKERLKELGKFKDKPVVVYCQTGVQSRPAGNILKKEGFQSVHTLSGGINAWLGANLPISKKSKKQN